MSRTYFVSVTGEPTDPEDHVVPGLYAVEIDDTVDPDDDPIAPGQIAGAVLDSFHDHIAIGMLDDFEICVLDDEGNQIDQDEDYEEGSLEYLTEFLGSVEGDDVPAAVLAFYQS